MVKSIETPIERRIEAVIRILCDVRPHCTAEAAYLFAQTVDNETSVIDAAKKIVDDSVASLVLLLKTQSVQGYPGFDAWKGKLLERGIPETLIAPIELHPADTHNTLTEATALVRFARQRRYRAIVISAAPFHQVRAFMTVVRGVLSEFPELKIYSLPGSPLPWTESPARGYPEAVEWVKTDWRAYQARVSKASGDTDGLEPKGLLAF